MQYIDVVKTQHDKHCYTIITLDSCLNATASDTFCTITLTGTALDEADQIFWTPFKGYKLTNYQIQTLKNGKWGLLNTQPVTKFTQINDSLHCYLPQYYRVYATEVSGGQNRVTYSDSIQIIPFDTIKPAAPLLKYASVQSNGNIKLLWNYNIHSNSKFFEVWRSVNGGKFDSLTTLTFDSTYIDKNINTHDTVRYFIKAVDSCKATLVSKPSDTAKIINVKLITGFCKDENKISWSAYQTLPGGTSSYTIFKSTSGGPFTKLVTLSGNTYTYLDTIVSPRFIYTYKIFAYNAAANLGSYSDTFRIKNLPYLPADTAKTIFATVLTSGTTNGSIFVEWNADPKKDTVARGYRLYEANPADNIYHLIFQTTNLSDTSYTQTNVNTLTQGHEYKISVFNGCNNDGPSGKYQLPVQLEVVSKNNLTINLKWLGYQGVPVTAYDIYRSDNKALPVKIASLPVPPTDTLYTDSNIVCRHHYTYLIKTRLTNGLISLSDTIGAIAADTIPPPKSSLYVISVDSTLTTGGKISLRFNGNKRPSRSGFNIYRAVNNGPFSLYFQLLSTKSDTVYWQDQGANTVANSYSYYIAATDSCGNQALAGDTDKSVHLTAKAVSLYNQLNWSAYRGFKNLGYAIERRIINSNWQKIANVDASTFNYRDSNIVCKIFYQYRIRYNDASSQLFGYSNIAGDTAIDTVSPKINHIQYVTVQKTGINNGAVQISWDSSSTRYVVGYYVYQSLDNYHYTMVGKLVRGNTTLDNNLNSYQQAYYYRITPFDTCGNVGRGFSAVSKTINLHAEAGDQKVTLNWNKYIGWRVKTYNIIRDGATIATVADTITSYTDTLTTCIKFYHYTIKAIADSSANFVSYSNIDSAHPFDNIPPQRVYVREAYIDVPGGLVRISWDASKAFDLKNYYVFRKRASDGAMVFVDSTAQTSLTEPLSNITGPDCYYVFARDLCRNQSFGSNLACLIILNGRSERDYDSLYWNSYREWQDGVQAYNVFKNEDNGGWIQIGSTTANTLTYNDKNLTNNIIDYCYQVKAVENNGKYNDSSLSTIICLHQDPFVYIPDAFTPNATPGINDSFGPKGMFIKNYHMTIYNRWGQVVYRTDTGNGWDGTKGGAVVPIGIYMYEIQIDGYNNKPLRFKGNVMVLY